MTIRRPLVNISGAIQELPFSDSLASTDIVAGFYYVPSSETIQIPVNRLVLKHNKIVNDGIITIDGILTNKQ